MDTKDFYIGYLDRAPTAVAAFVRKCVAAILAATVVIAVVIAAGYKDLYPSVFEFLNYRTFEGVIHASPYPSLLIDRPGVAGAKVEHSRYYLSGEGKYGAQKEVGAFDGQRVVLRGSLIYRDDQTMIEVVAGSAKRVSEQPGESSPVGGRPADLGTFTFTGEIVDSKCFLGVMNPGEGKTHRACAARCISGGVPPVFAVREASGSRRYLLLVSDDGSGINQQVLPFVAEPLRITGRVERFGDHYVLRANPASYRRVRD